MKVYGLNAFDKLVEIVEGFENFGLNKKRSLYFKSYYQRIQSGYSQI